MTSMTSTARVRARSRAPYIRKLFFLIFIFSKFQSVSPEELILENRKMPSEWLGVHGGRSYGPSPRGSSLPGPAVRYVWYCSTTVPYHCTGEYEGEKAAGAGAEGRGELTGNSPLGRWSWGWRAKPQNHSRYCCVSGLTAGPGVRMYGTVDDPSLQY